MILSGSAKREGLGAMLGLVAANSELGQKRQDLLCSRLDT